MRAEDVVGSRPALDVLLRRYLPALRSHLLLRRRLSQDQVEELLQGFISSKVLGSHLIQRADRSKGKFRTLLLTALDRYVIDQHRSAAVQKRLFANSDDEQPATAATPHTVDSFDVAWGRQILGEALRRMRQECDSRHRNDLWQIFEQRVLRPALNDQPPPDYRQLARLYGFTSPIQAGNAIITARRMMQRILRNVVAEYATDDEEVDEEIRDLHRILSGHA